MASYPVTVYRWDDVGAPQIGNGRASDIIDIWQKCLVDGYGSKAPLGWTRPFYDAATQRAAFRNNIGAGGSGGYAVLYSNTLNDADYNLMRLTHAKSMPDINTLVGKGITKAFQVLNQAGSSRFTKWVLIGTAIGFYFVISQDDKTMGGTALYNPSMYVGDLFSTTPNDAGRFITDTGGSSTTDNVSIGFNQTLDNLSGNTVRGSVIMWSADNSNVSATYSRMYTTGMQAPTSLETVAVNSPLVLGFCYYSRAPLGSTVAFADVSDTKNPYLRGFLPGLFQATKYFPFDLVWPQIFDIGGVNYWMMRSSQGCPNVFVQLGEWHDPFS